jgi:hypothetical protein
MAGRVQLQAPPAGEWRRVALNVQEFESQWGEGPDLAGGSVTFRIGKDAGQRLTFVVDDLRTTPLPEGIVVNQGKEPIKVSSLVKPEAVRALSERPRLLFPAGNCPPSVAAPRRPIGDVLSLMGCGSGAMPR